MEEKESTVSASPENSDTDDSPPPISSTMAIAPPQPQLINLNFKTSISNIVGNAVAPTNVGSSNSELFGKKKRGRPRKYDGEGKLRVKQTMASSTGFSFSSHTDHGFSSSGSSSKRGRGRPGDFHLLASLGDLFVNTAGGDFTPHITTVNTGEDVAGKILTLSQKGSRGICVLSANGAVSNVTLRQPGSAGGILTYEGRFEIISLSGSFTVTDSGGVKSRTGGLSVSLAGPDGRVIGGGVAGGLLAASPIQIVLGFFMPNGFKAQKVRKQQREATMASAIPSSAKLILPGKPEEDQTRMQSTLPQQTQNRDAADSGGNGHGISRIGSFHLSGWNGIDTALHRRPSPDINLSVPSEDEEGAAAPCSSHVEYKFS